MNPKDAKDPRDAKDVKDPAQHKCCVTGCDKPAVVWADASRTTPYCAGHAQSNNHATQQYMQRMHGW